MDEGNMKGVRSERKTKGRKWRGNGMRYSPERERETERENKMDKDIHGS